MIDTEQADLWEGREQIRKSCATQAPQDPASVNARPTLGEIMVVILFVVLGLFMAFAVLTDPAPCGFWAAAHNTVCPPGMLVILYVVLGLFVAFTVLTDPYPGGF